MSAERPGRVVSNAFRVVQRPVDVDLVRRLLDIACRLNDYLDRWGDRADWAKVAQILGGMREVIVKAGG